MHLLSPENLLSLVSAPQPPASPLSASRWILIDTTGAEGFDDSALCTWLKSVPAPVIAIGGAGSALTDACDVHMADEARLPLLLHSIQRCPIAATVLVQTLRLAARLSIEEALVVESLAYASLQQGAEFRRWQMDFKPPAAAPMETGPDVEIERDGNELRLVLNRPGNRNAMTTAMRDGLIEALELAIVDDSIDQVRIEARGRCFSTGGDLREFGSTPDPATAHIVRSLALPGRLLSRIAGKCTVRVHGACVGSGIEFPAFAGRILAAADAWFQLPELRYGLIPGAGGTVSVARRIGRQRTAWLGLSGERIDVRTALDWGLVDAVVP